MRNPSVDERPTGCNHYSSPEEVPPNLRKYYDQRHSLFSRFDDGIWMTSNAWFGVTPEPVAKTIAKHVAEAASPDKSILIDCFAGVGGNTIAFALSGRWKRVYGIEKDARALACAKHNAQIYEVEDQISWYEGDCFEILSNQLADLAPYSIVFASPPWGGPTYRSNKIFDLNTMVPYSLDTLYKSFCNYSGNIVLYLPRTSDMRQLAKKGNATGPILVMHYCMEGASKALCAFYGDFREDEISID